MGRQLVERPRGWRDRDDHGRVSVQTVRGPFVRPVRHPEAVEDERSLLRWARGRTRPLAVDLFCGAGGLSLGLEEAGFDVILGVDHDEEAVETHASLCGGLHASWDLGNDEVVDRVVTLMRKAKVTLLAGGPPCQPFSRAGRHAIRDLVRNGVRPAHDARRDLWESFLAVAVEARPAAVVMENVPDMALDREMGILRVMVQTLENAGYSVEEQVAQAWRFGVPQFRNRLILVALRDGIHFEWPDPTPDRVTVENAIGDLPLVEGGWRPDGGAGGSSPYPGPRSTFQKMMRVGIDPALQDRVFDHITRPVRDDDAKAFALMGPSTRYSDLPEELKRYREDIFDDKYKRLDAHDLSRTITAHIAKDGYWYIHPTQDRTLTVREAARLQTFPDRVRFAGSPTSAFRQIGNAVPPRLGSAIGGAVLRSIEVRAKKSRSTTVVANLLAEWWRRVDPAASAMPWLRVGGQWTVLIGELILDRAARDVVRKVWPALARFDSPSITIARSDDLLEMSSWIGRPERAVRALEVAEAVVANPELLASAEAMQTLPQIGPALADLVFRADRESQDDPVLVTRGVLRVAARFFGEPVDRQNRLTDGRLAIARMIGWEDNSDESHMALFELASSVCTSTRPACGICPLQGLCAEVTSGRRPRQEPLFD